MKPVFSIIMTSFNYAQYIAAAIESVLAQTFDRWELLIVDDCSIDDSWDIINKYKDPRIKAYRHEINAGACAAYNLALSMAQGDYIASLDSDDIYMPTKLEYQAAFFAEHVDVGICGTRVKEIDSLGVEMICETGYASWFNEHTQNLNDPAGWIWENRLCHSGAIIRTDLHLRIGEFDTQLTYTPDWQFWVRALVAGVKFAVLNEYLVGYRNHGNNITHKNSQKMLIEHATTSAGIFFPWLKQQQRFDLIEKSLQGFISNRDVVLSIEIRKNVVQRLVGESSSDLMLMVWEQCLNKDHQLSELQTGKDWLEQQWHASQEQLIGKETELAVLQTGKDWLEQQWKALQEQLIGKETELAVLQTGKDWLEQQWQALKQQSKGKHDE